jgi:2-polyprenyl-3-methyl-5-hydroxy-6-metoxy-1,4-benzoquinol methylase
MAAILTLPTELSAEELTAELKKHEPWGHRIDFTNGVSTSQFQRRTPFAEHLLGKFLSAAKEIPFDQLRGGRLLDIGCNSGHNSIYAAVQYGLRPTGIDVTQRHMEVSSFLSGLAGIDAEFLLADAETFVRPATFDVVLHFGTLYHLPNPMLSLKSTYDNLKPGGYLALETQTYEDPSDPNACAYINMLNNDPTNFWALSEHVLGRYLEHLGFENVTQVLKAKPAILPERQFRVVMTARKPL